MFELFRQMEELGFRSKDVDSLGDSAEDFDDVQDDLIEALLDATERALEDMAGLANSPKYVYLFIYLGFLRHFQHCTGHIMTGSWKGRGNQYIQFVRVLYCKLLTNGKKLPAFPLRPCLEPNSCLRGGRRECYRSATVAQQNMFRINFNKL